MDKPFPKIEETEVELSGKQPLMSLEIRGPEAQTLSDVLASVENEKQGMVLPTTATERIRWAEKAFDGAVKCIAILITLGEEGMFPNRGIE